MLCEQKYVIVNLLCRVYQEVKIMTLPEKKKNQKKIRRGRRKEKTLLTQVMFQDEHEQFQKAQMLRLYTNCYTSVLVLMVYCAVQCPCQFQMQFALLQKHDIKRFA